MRQPRRRRMQHQQGLRRRSPAGRGQAWGVYGTTAELYLPAIETVNRSAKTRLANCFLNRLPEDYDTARDLALVWAPTRCATLFIGGNCGWTDCRAGETTAGHGSDPRADYLEWAKGDYVTADRSALSVAKQKGNGLLKHSIVSHGECNEGVQEWCAGRGRVPLRREALPVRFTQAGRLCWRRERRYHHAKRLVAGAPVWGVIKAATPGTAAKPAVRAWLPVCPQRLSRDKRWRPRPDRSGTLPRTVPSRRKPVQIRRLQFPLSPRPPSRSLRDCVRPSRMSRYHRNSDRRRCWHSRSPRGHQVATLVKSHSCRTQSTEQERARSCRWRSPVHRHH